MRKQTRHRSSGILCILMMAFLLSGCAQEKAAPIKTAELDEPARKAAFSESNEKSGWTEAAIKEQFSGRFDQDDHWEIVDCEVISDHAFERVGAVLLKDSDAGTTEVALMDGEGYFQKLGISAELAEEPEFSYLGNGVISFQLLTAEGTPYPCEVHFSFENNAIRYTVKDLLPES